MSASTYGFNGNNPFVSIYSVDNNGNLQSPAETRPVSLNGDGPFTVNCPATMIQYSMIQLRLLVLYRVITHFTATMP